MNLDTITLEDAVENYQRRNRTTVLENGAVKAIKEGEE
jgi:hypothetical protein